MEIAKNITIFIKNYDLFIDKVSTLFPNEEHKEYLKLIKEEPKNKKWDRGTALTNNINKSNENFIMFCESKIKVFSNKNNRTKEISSSLFGDELLLKTIFNNKTNDVKCVLWMYLHQMVYTIEKSQKNVNEDRILLLSTTITNNTSVFDSYNKEQRSAKTLIKDIFGVEVNNNTNDMLDDIMGSFESSLKGNNVNPLSGILDISKKISSKYQDQIMNGDIQLNKLVEGLQSKLPGMMPGMDSLFKSGMSGIMNNNKEKEKETVIIDENFSTDNVELGKVDDNKSNLNIGKMLNMANSLGVLGGKGSDAPNIMNMLGGNGFTGIMDMFKNMKPSEDGSGNINMPDMSNLTDMFKNMNLPNLSDLSGMNFEDMFKNISGNKDMPDLSNLSEMFKENKLMDMFKNINLNSESSALNEMNNMLPMDDEMTSIIEKQNNN